MFLLNTCYIYTYYFTIWNFRKFFFFKQVFKFFYLLINKNILFSIIVNVLNSFRDFFNSLVIIISNLNLVNVYIYISYIFYRSTGFFFFAKELVFYISLNFLNTAKLGKSDTFVLFNRSEYILNLESYKSVIYDFQFFE